ncbi:arabinogalactan endo-1,4-beta-galactosidase [Kineococcus xinjiangensis]|uniref:Arabinogalactan endo-beta-1,4-galactanase n=1 Tax=Kineococcus xinjiangensis TaxID=512762 RepID=A0A2S6IVU0_9ACTN|nr:glycosyl hydrolase 53 family protein [Kineococcus xinjiangensis]PPK98415.1 arabinogalactan endo-1,4-beta-galactosidase [Kineococcus xinjiangensis]
MSRRINPLRAALVACALAVPVAVAGTTAPTASAANVMTMLGGDVSTLQRTQDLQHSGATTFKYYNAAGTVSDPIDVLKGAGMNYARLRIWHNPKSGYNNKAKVLQQARTLKAKGLKVMIDFHYSDTWADPGKQYKPAAWSTHSLTQLQKDVYDHTYDVCTALKAQGTTPDSVQIGNEINVGMLWNEGKVVNSKFAPLAALLKSGYNATKACNAGTQVIIHTAHADSNAKARWFFDGITAQGVRWDITGQSYYCMWHGTLGNLYNNIVDLRTRYGKPVVIVETAYPFTTADADGFHNSIPGTTTCDGIPATWEGQAKQFTWVQNTARNAGALGVFYWEPTWTAVKGNGWNPDDINGSGNEWENMAVFDWNGRVNPHVRWTP